MYKIIIYFLDNNTEINWIRKSFRSIQKYLKNIIRNNPYNPISVYPFIYYFSLTYLPLYSHLFNMNSILYNILIYRKMCIRLEFLFSINFIFMFCTNDFCISLYIFLYF